jgi:Zn finger protein HypA/HybF involved in hydrogenase expression
MAAVSITCPACRKRIKAREEHLGRKIRCPNCQNSFVAEADAEETDAPIAFADDDKPKAKPAKPKPTAAMKAEKPAEPKPVETKAPESKPVDVAAYGIETIDTQARCPNCAELMADPTAIICIHCGYNTLTRTYGKTRRVYAASREEILQHLMPAMLFSAAFLALVLVVLWYNTVVPPAFNGTRSDWVVHESLRMWSTMVIVAFLWWFGFFAFRTFVLHPLPEEVEKE